MPIVLRQLHTANSLVQLCFKMEQERKFTLVILAPSLSTIVLEILISFPWRRNTNKQTNNALHEIAN